MKRAYLVHGWSGNPENSFFPWLKKELEARGYAVTAFAMPDADEPRIETWVPFLESNIPSPDAETVLVGHSIGCQAIMRYLAQLPAGMTVGTVILVAGWIHKLTNLYDADELKIAAPWIETPIDFVKVRANAPNILAVFSDNDRFVTIDNVEVFNEKLGARTIVKPAQGHFADEDGVTEIPEILTAL